MSHANQRCPDPTRPAAAGAADRRSRLAGRPGRRALRRVLADREARGPTGTAARAPAGMADRSSRAAPPAEPDPGAGGPQDRAPALEAAAGPGRDRRPARDAGLDRARGPGPLPAQPALPHRPGHRRADPPLRARAPRATCSTWTSRSSATSPTAAAGATSAASRATGTGPPPPAHSRRNSKYRNPLIGHRVRAHRHRRPLPGRLRRDPRRRDRRHRRRGAAPRGGLVRRPRRHRRAGALRQRLLPTAPTSGATPAPSSASPQDGPGPTGHRPTARSNASTAPWPTAGPSRQLYTSEISPPRRPASMAPRVQPPPAPHRHRRTPPITRLNNLAGHHS